MSSGPFSSTLIAPYWFLTSWQNISWLMSILSESSPILPWYHMSRCWFKNIYLLDSPMRDFLAKSKLFLSPSIDSVDLSVNAWFTHPFSVASDSFSFIWPLPGNSFFLFSPILTPVVFTCYRGSLKYQLQARLTICPDWTFLLKPRIIYQTNYCVTQMYNWKLKLNTSKRELLIFLFQMFWNLF